MSQLFRKSKPVDTDNSHPRVQRLYIGNDPKWGDNLIGPVQNRQML